MRDLCHAQSAAGHSVGIICNSTTGGAFEDALFADLAPYLALGLIRVPMHRQIALSDFAAARRVYKAAKPLAPDVLHGHGAKGGAYARLGGTLLRQSGHPVARIYTPHGGSLHYDARKLKYRVYFQAGAHARTDDGRLHLRQPLRGERLCGQGSPAETDRRDHSERPEARASSSPSHRRPMRATSSMSACCAT